MSLPVRLPAFPQASTPRAPESCLVVPAAVAAAMEVYELHYTSLKAPRKLHWKPHLGCVELQVRARRGKNGGVIGVLAGRCRHIKTPCASYAVAHAARVMWLQAT